MMSKILTVLSILFGAMFINSGLNKFFFYMPMPEEMPEKVMKVMGAFETIGWIMPLVAIVEIVAGLLMFFKKTRVLGAIMMLPIMVGIILTHAINMQDNMLIQLILLAINVLVLIDGRAKIAGLVK